MKNQDARSLPSVAQEDLRRKAVKAVLDGRKQVEVANLFGVTRQTVGRWVKAYREGGAKALKAKDIKVVPKVVRFLAGKLHRLLRRLWIVPQTSLSCHFTFGRVRQLHS